MGIGWHNVYERHCSKEAACLQNNEKLEEALQ